MNNDVMPRLPVKAIICTVYGTVLESGAPPADADACWAKLWREKLGRPPRTALAEFNRSADLALDVEARLLSVRGIENPAPYWPGVAEQLLPELRELATESVSDFLYTHAQLRRSVRLREGAGAVLRTCQARNCLLGLISNGQPHTPLELALALYAPSGAVESFFPPAAAKGCFTDEAMARELEIFTPPLCFWSYAHGFGKPNAHAFQHVATRLRARRIQASEVMMVGSDEDCDLVPARRFGWRTWLISDEEMRCSDAGTWSDLAGALGFTFEDLSEITTAKCTN
jgi:FMN phosphatase YigB (HAD superfamily)